MWRTAKGPAKKIVIVLNILLICLLLLHGLWTYKSEAELAHRLGNVEGGLWHYLVLNASSLFVRLLAIAVLLLGIFLEVRRSSKAAIVNLCVPVLALAGLIWQCIAHFNENPGETETVLILVALPLSMICTAYAFAYLRHRHVEV